MIYCVSDKDRSIPLQELEKIVYHLISSSRRPNTRRTYSSAQRKFMDFCNEYNFSYLPCSQQTLLYYIAFLYSKCFKLSYIKVYLSVIRSMHVESGFDNSLDDCIRLDLALRTIAISSEGPKQKLPVTLQLLASVKRHLDDTYNSK